MRTSFVLGIAVLLLAGCGEPAGSSFTAEIIFTAPAKLGGLDIGDLDPNVPGNEIAAVSITGEIHLLARKDGKWTHERLGAAPGEMIQCVIADADPRTPGNELVCVGMAEGTEEDGGGGAVNIVSRCDDGWLRVQLDISDALIHGVAVGDFDPDRPGNEIMCVGFEKKALLLFPHEGAWDTECVADLPGHGKNAVPYEGGVAIVTSAGTIDHLVKSDGEWVLTNLVSREKGQSRLGTDGVRLLSAGDDGVLLLVEDGKATPIHTESMKLRGAILADLDPDSPGIEAATAGYEMKLTVLRKEGETWRAETVFEDTGKFHHLAAGELLPESKGVELAACGYSRNVVVIRSSRP